jgi:predicted metal-dependent hydrolase
VLKKRKEIEVSVPARIQSRTIGLVARTSKRWLQKSLGDNWSRISSANALQKEWQG